MRVKTLLLAAVGVSSVLGGTSNLKAPKRNKVNLVPIGEDGDHCCNQGIEDLKDFGACHKCQPWQNPDTTTARITSDTTAATVTRVEDKSTPCSSKPIDAPTWVTTHKPHVPTFTPPAKAREVTIMVDPSTHPHLQPNTTGNSVNTRPSDPVLPLCMEGGNVVPAKSFPEPWCSKANKQFHCQFCSHGYQPPSSVGNSLTRDLNEQDFEVWTVKQTLGDLTKITKEDADIQSRETSPRLSCCIRGGKPQWDCNICRSTRPTANPSLSQPPKTLDARKQNDICCYFNGVQTCYVFDAGQEPPSAVDGEVTVWSRRQALGGDTYEYEMVSDGKSGVANDMQAKICCIAVLGFTYCFECQSATSATESSAATTVTRPHNAAGPMDLKSSTATTVTRP
ncbi:hypothetical protein LTR70_003813 [Exophiala xenobiotica]|uniref:Uncharacterized protein n=1 Tax=Lithohypha guttulata TaxID=1690604 RepID=A0ABR0KF41_9EURO|nr:hypothetical protein LTR24_003320 [Lithohypha guttulata]KAK5322311.1 hypothetical protein LTR70_003813 [Exophiala xenobiotica]